MPFVKHDLKNNFSKINDIIRENSYVFSLSENYDLDNMWTYYSNNNGYCIEYDFSKVKYSKSADRDKLLFTCKVYYEDKENFDFMNYLKLVYETNDKEKFNTYNRLLISQLLTKKTSWKEEKEWRIFLSNLGENNKLYIDIVSAIYLDSSFVDTDNGKCLISLAKERKWNIYIRKFNSTLTKFEYKEYKG